MDFRKKQLGENIKLLKIYIIGPYTKKFNKNAAFRSFLNHKNMYSKKLVWERDY